MKPRAKRDVAPPPQFDELQCMLCHTCYRNVLYRDFLYYFCYPCADDDDDKKLVCHDCCKRRYPDNCSSCGEQGNHICKVLGCEEDGDAQFPVFDPEQFDWIIALSQQRNKKQKVQVVETFEVSPAFPLDEEDEDDE